MPGAPNSARSLFSASAVARFDVAVHHEVKPARQLSLPQRDEMRGPVSVCLVAQLGGQPPFEDAAIVIGNPGLIADEQQQARM